jgi:hypothetical protein
MRVCWPKETLGIALDRRLQISVKVRDTLKLLSISVGLPREVVRSVNAATGHGLRRPSAWPQEEEEEEMKVQRVFRASRKTAEERAREHILRAKLQKEKPSPEELIRAGECDPDAVTTMGM